MLVTALLLSLFLAVFSITAVAATPNNQACVGTDFSGYARYGNSVGIATFRSGSGFVGTISYLAQNSAQPRFGGDVQNHMAGLVPDSLIPNTCNN